MAFGTGGEKEIMKKLRLSLLILFSALLLSFLLGGCGEGGGTPSSHIPEWTIMVFMNDATLASRELAGIDLYEMRQIGSTDDVKILVQRCSETGVGMVRYLVEKENMKLLDTLSDASPTSSDALASFANWCFENYPAEKYLLILWSRDESSSWSSLVSYINLVRAFSSFSENVDLLVLDSPVKAELELLDEIKNSVSITVALQGIIPDDGFNYEDVFRKIAASPHHTALEISGNFVDDFKKLYGKRSDVAISVIDMAKVANVVGYLNDLGNDLLAFSDISALWGVVLQTQSYFIAPGEEASFRDLYDFCDRLEDLDLSDSAKETVDNLKKAMEDMVKSEWHVSDGIVSGSHGISLYIYSLGDRKETYGGFTIATDASDWYEFIKTKF